MYKNAEDSVKFPVDKAMPLELIAEIVRFRVKENREKKVMLNAGIRKLYHLGLPE